MASSDSSNLYSNLNKSWYLSGVTASGKTSLAIELALSSGRHLVNADSMQIYSNLSVVTARPSSDELAPLAKGGLKLFLDGYIDGKNSRHSFVKYQRDVQELISNLQQPVIFVGGSGLFLKYIAELPSKVVELSQDVEEKLDAKFSQEGTRGLYNWLKQLSRTDAEELQPNDKHRIRRRLGVFLMTGESMTMLWQSNERGKDRYGSSGQKQCLAILTSDGVEGELSYEDKLMSRIKKMFGKLSLNEVEQLYEGSFNVENPIYKAIGVKEVLRFASGEISEQEAGQLILFRTRQYAKRQKTWFRNQFTGAFSSNDVQAIFDYFTKTS